jgi:hypothetical protein
MAPQKWASGGLGCNGRPDPGYAALAAGASLSLQVTAEATADPHNHDWAGPGFIKPGPESNVGYQAGYALGRVEACAGMTTIFPGPTTTFTDGYINGHRQMTEHLAREANGREAEEGG